MYMYINRRRGSELLSKNIFVCKTTQRNFCNPFLFYFSPSTTLNAMFKQIMSCSRVSVQVSRLLLLDLRLLLQSVPFSVSRLYSPLLYSLYSLSVKYIIRLTRGPRGPWNAHLRLKSSLCSSLYVQQVTTGRSKSEGLSFTSIHNNFCKI